MASKQHNSDHSIIAANADAADLFKRFKRFAYGSKSQAPLPESWGATTRRSSETLRPSISTARRTCGLFRHSVGIDHIARLVLGRHYYDLRREVLELGEIVAPDMLELNLEHPRLRPLALGPEFHIPDHGLKRGLADVIG